MTAPATRISAVAKVCVVPVVWRFENLIQAHETPKKLPMAQSKDFPVFYGVVSSFLW